MCLWVSSGHPAKQAGSSPIVTPVRRGWGRENCPTVCQPWVVRARRAAPARPHLWGYSRGSPRGRRGNLSPQVVVPSGTMAWGRRPKRVRCHTAESRDWHPWAPRGGRGGPAWLVWLPLASSLWGSREVRARFNSCGQAGP